MNIAVLADTHGRILLAFKVVERWQRETGETIDLILQCGDMGIYPDVSKLDRATIRHAESDETELGFSKYFVERNDEAEKVLSQVSCNLLCVRGNHEDQEFLDDLESQAIGSSFPCDCYDRVHVLKTGMLHNVSVGDDRLQLLGIGRVGPPAGESDVEKLKYIQPPEQRRLKDFSDDRLDILVTHDARRDFIRPGIGMQEITRVLEDHTPAYHFFGHTGEPFQRRIDANGTTVASKLSDFEWDEEDPSRPLKEGCLGILRWADPSNHTFEVVNAPWLKEYTMHTWQYV